MPDNMLLDAHDDDLRTARRPRQHREIDVGARPYTIPVPGPSGAHSEGDGNTEGGAKKSNRKKPLSCGECRRLKLKCDRVFPCQSCCKRGCAEICPDGALTGGKGSRFILANTEQLHDKIKAMSERIRQLEEALQSLQSRLSKEEHPLLRQELLSIKKSPELFGVGEHNMGTALSAREIHHRNDESMPESSSSSLSHVQFQHLQPLPGLSDEATAACPEDFARLSRAFPAPWAISYQLNPDVRARIRDMLPSRSEATYLCEQARDNAFWQFNPDGREAFLPNLIHSVYDTPISSLLPHRLGLFLSILAIGCRVDLNQRSEPRDSEKYHTLARVALCEMPLMLEASFDAVYALFFMVWYLLMFSEQRGAVEYAWGVSGLLIKLAHTIGLHRDGVRSKVIPEELETRRILYWDIVHLDARLSMMLRRPPSINIRYADAHSPQFSAYGCHGQLGAQFHTWQYNFHNQCMLRVADYTASMQPVSYRQVLELDSKIRDFEVPDCLRMCDIADGNPPHPQAIEQAMVACSREVALLQLHRSYYTTALNGPEGFSFKHRYAPSVLATFTSCCNLIWTVYTLYRWEPSLSVRFSAPWINCFSSALALVVITSRLRAAPLALTGLQELDRVLALFTEARDTCDMVSKFLPATEVLVSRTYNYYIRFHTGQPIDDGDIDDEICHLAHRTGILSQPPPPEPPTPASSIPLSPISSSMSTISDDGSAGPPSIPNSFDYAHPVLVKYLEQSKKPACNQSVYDKLRALESGACVSGDESTPDRGKYSFGKGIDDALWMTWF
ncbi:hypothetical protein K474DRAFT_1652176 [Panus rudis PR-1116 ss-1]|nr:hypothetical protein K474DRAFT_1652176 [Panus rudis PR-1116 ss-1]